MGMAARMDKGRGFGQEAFDRQITNNHTSSYAQ
jgi:hypothetical protein